MASTITNESNVLTLDFWEDQVIYEGQAFHTGTLACHALNIPAEVITKMEALGKNLNAFLAAFNSGRGDPALLPAARLSALKLSALMLEHRPFCFINGPIFRGLVEKAFTPDSVKIANAFIHAQRTGKLTEQLEEKYTWGILLLRLLPVLAHLGYALKEFQTTMIPFAEKIHEAQKRIDVSYAEIFRQHFPAEPTFEDAGGWMSMTNVTQQYITIPHPKKKHPLLVKRMHFVSFVGLLRSDFFEGLRLGNGPKRCLYCRRWFLTTDGYLTYYCSDLAPGDPKRRACKVLGARTGIKETPQGHIIKKNYERRRNSVSKAVHRGTMDADLAAMILKLAEAKGTKARLNNAYLQGAYEREMAADAIKAEALAALGRSE